MLDTISSMSSIMHGQADEDETVQPQQLLNFASVDSMGFIKRRRTRKQGGERRQFWQIEIPLDRVCEYVEGEEARCGCKFWQKRGPPPLAEGEARVFQLKDRSGELKFYNKVRK